MKKLWKDMSAAEKEAIIIDGRRAGKSDEQIGKKIGASKGQIVGYRHIHLPQLTGKTPAEVERLYPSESRIAAAPPKKAESSGICEWPTGSGGSLKKPKLCGKPAIAGHRVCSEHKAILDALRSRK